MKGVDERFREALEGKPMTTGDVDEFTAYLKKANSRRKIHGSLQINSFVPFQSPVDFKMINNRNDLRNHNKEHNVEQVGNDYVPIINERREEERERRESSGSAH